MKVRIVLAVVIAAVLSLTAIRLVNPGHTAASRIAAQNPRQTFSVAESAPRPAEVRSRRHFQFTADERAIIGANWANSGAPEFAAFRGWVERFLATSQSDRVGLMAEGVELARKRRAAMAELIRLDPRMALAAAVPMVVRQQLPAEIVDQLESRVSAVGELAQRAAMPAPGEQLTGAAVYRTTLINQQEYFAYVYGRRESFATVGSTSMVGVAVDRVLAISEAPLRVLESGEVVGARTVVKSATAAGNSSSVSVATAVEFDGKVHLLSSSEEVSRIEADLIAAETSPRLAADDQPGTSGVSGRPSQAWTHGTKKVLIILVDFSDFPGTPVYPSGSVPINDDYVLNKFTATNGICDFYAQSSYGLTALSIAASVAGDSPDVTPVLRMPQTATAYATGGLNSTLHTDAESAAQAAGYTVSNYDRVGVVFRFLGTSTITGSQLTYAGLGDVEGTRFWINGYFDFRVVAHEIGHNYGLNHANLWQVSDGNPVSAAGSSTEYGDIFDVMGSNGDITLDFSAWNKSILQWLPDNAVTTVAAPGTYRVYRFDHAAANLANARALKVVRDSTRDYWIGYRRATSNSSMNNGAYILWGYNTNEQSNLLDMTTPGSSANDAGLAIGTTFNDSARGITIKPLAQGGSGAEEYLDVQIGLTPLLQWASTSVSIGETSGSVTLTVTRSRNSSGAISVDYATSSGSATSGSDFTAMSGTLNWADGDTSSRTITVPITADVVTETSESFTVALLNSVGATLGDVTSATVTINDPGVRDSGFNSDFINNSVEKVLALPGGGFVLGGYFTQVQASDYTVYTRSGITKLEATGALDPSFASEGGTTGTPVYDLVLQPDGKIIAVGGFTAMNGTARNRIARVNSDGSIDTSFDPGSGANGTVYAVLLQPDGKLVVGGSFTTINGTAREYLARLNADGSLDTTFVGPNFQSSSGWRVESLAMQADGKILVGGQNYLSSSQPFKSGLCRVNSDGSLDTAFTGVTYGAHDISGTNNLRSVKTIAIQPDGKILVGGDFTAFNNVARPGVARLNIDGSLDTGFASSLTSDGGTVNTLAYLPDGRVMAGGAFLTMGGVTVNRIAVLSTAGAVDTAFAAAGGYAAGMTSKNIRDLALLPDGRMILGGDIATFQSSTVQRPVWVFAGAAAGVPGTVQISALTAAGYEGASAQLSVTRGGTGLGALTVGYTTLAGTAGTSDYTTTAGILSWADGDVTPKTITVPLLSDGVVDPDENFFVQLGQPLIGAAILGVNQRATVTINEPLTGYAAFNAANFSSTELADTAISGPNADPDGDGLVNILEYALGLNPKSVDNSGLPLAAASGTDWVFTYSRPSSTTDLVYTEEFSTDLASWGTGSIASRSLLSSVNGTETWEVRVPKSVSATAFFRLKVVR